jgi:hypothetical protein
MANTTAAFGSRCLIWNQLDGIGDRTDTGRSLLRRSESTDIQHNAEADMDFNVDSPDCVGADNFIDGQWRHRLHCSAHSRKTIDFRPGE